MKRRIAFLIIIVALVVGGWYVYPHFIQKPVQTNKLVLSGNFEAHEALLSFKVQGRIIDLPIEEGQWVEPGGGVPTAINSARQAVQLLCAELQRPFVATTPEPR